MRSLKRHLVPAAAAIAMLGSIASYPPVLALATWDGRVESIPGPVMMWYVISVLLLALAVSLALVWALNFRRSPGRSGGSGRRFIARAALTAVGFGVVGVSALAIAYAGCNRVDVLAALSADHPLCREARDLARSQGRRAAMNHVADYFPSRPAPRLVKPAQLWLTGEALESQARQFAAGGFPGFPEFSWHPGRRINWRCGAKSPRMPLLFELQGQRFMFALVASPGQVPQPERIALALAFAEQWRRDNPVWPNANRYAWNDDATANRIQAHILLMERARRLRATSRKDEVEFLK